jgi:hypothetical protein
MVVRRSLCSSPTTPASAGARTPRKSPVAVAAEFFQLANQCRNRRRADSRTGSTNPAARTFQKMRGNRTSCARSRGATSSATQRQDAHLTSLFRRIGSASIAPPQRRGAEPAREARPLARREFREPTRGSTRLHAKARGRPGRRPQHKRKPAD